MERLGNSLYTAWNADLFLSLFVK